ncbi:hypothetical protein BB561_005156 [Smittium simulii]|uniref:Exportin-7/Ran-binding protein 17 TPR repeats domain-containing protein n=1 Tax=Smittium simulii TaxID=133385 RepID=A0A2T9YBS1_9FUNG|nr:hypothetical protein BB561_005156 [Smittium simulii]
MELDQTEQPTIDLLDSICTRLYQSLDTGNRTLAEKQLYYFFPSFVSTQESTLYPALSQASIDKPLIEVYRLIKTPLDSLKHLIWFLQQTTNNYSKFYSSQRIKALTLSYATSISTADLESVGQCLVSIIASHQDISNFSILNEIAQAISIIIMVGWLASDEIIKIVDTIVSMYHGSDFNKFKSLLTLKILVQEISREQPKKYIPKQQRIASKFKDKNLKDIFKLAFDAMSEILLEGSFAQKNNILLESIELQKEVYLFDFVGLSNDNSEDDIISIQIPAGWRDIIEVPTFIDLYFDGYKRTSYPINTSFLELLSYFCSIRRTFYTDQLRELFTVKVSQGVIDIIENNIGLSEVDNYHQLCRLLSRFRTIHTFTEIESKPLYTQFLDAVSIFSRNGLSVWEWSENSLAPLLTFWVKTGSSKDYASGKYDSENKLVHKIKELLLDVLTNYLISLVSASSKSYIEESNLGDSLGNHDDILEQLNLTAVIARVNYAKSVSVLMLAINNIAAQYQNAINSNTSKFQEIEMFEVQLSWLTNSAAAFIAAKKPYNSPIEDDDSDAEMVAAVIELDNLKKIKSNKIGISVNTLFDLSILNFYFTYKSKYLNEKPHRNTRIFVKLSSLLGEVDIMQSLDIIIQRILQNLNSGDLNDAIISKSLDIFYDLSLGYNTVRQIYTINSIQNLITSKNVTALAFLSKKSSYKLRERYFSSIIRILTVSDTFDESLTSILNEWGNEVQSINEISKNIKYFNQTDLNNFKNKLICLLQTLRGCLTAIITKNSYNLFFLWIFTENFDILAKIVSFLPSDPEIQIAFLKFVKEFVTNKSQRIAFDISSPNGILIFQKISKILCQTNNNLKLNNISSENLYKHKYKLALVCWDIFSKILSGKYVAIGVMPIYNDKSLDNAFECIFDLIGIVPLDFVTTHTKTFGSLLCALDVILSKNNIFLARMKSITLKMILELCSSALNSPIISISSSSCSIIDQIFSFTIEYMKTGKSSVDLNLYLEYFDKTSGKSPICELLNGQTEIQTRFLSNIFDKILFEECQNEWSLSRALFPLVVLQKEFFYYRSTFITQHQPQITRDQLIKSLGFILNSTNYTLTPANRDKFTQAITQYRRDVDTYNINLVYPTTQNKTQAEFEFSDPTNKMLD